MGILRKIKKNGRVVLARNEYRIGNFIVTVTDERIAFRDINDMVSHSLTLTSPNGNMLKSLVDEWLSGTEGAENMLHAYISTMFNVLSCIPFTSKDSGIDYMNSLNELTLKCINVNKRLYGIEEDLTLEKDAEILRGLKEDYKNMNE